MAQITKSNSRVTSSATTSNWLIRHAEVLAPLFLVAAGTTILISHYLALAGFTGLLPIAVGMASIISGGVLVEHWERYSWLAVLMATGGAALCIMSLVNQLQTAELLAASVNSTVIFLQLTGAVLTLYHLIQPQT